MRCRVGPASGVVLSFVATLHLRTCGENIAVIAANNANDSFEICQQACCEHVGGGACDNDGSFDLSAISCGFVADRQGNAFSDECKIGATAVVPGDLATPQTAPGVTINRGAIGLASETHAEAIWIKQRSLWLEARPVRTAG